MTFLPRDFVVPDPVDGPLGTLVRSITVHDLVRDYDAVMSSQPELWAQFGEAWNWPQPDLTITQDLVDLGWHQKEFMLRSSFDYAVLSGDEERLLGCVYIDPPDPDTPDGFDAVVTWWVRTDSLETLSEPLEAFVRSWLAGAWPFRSVQLPGRDHPW